MDHILNHPAPRKSLLARLRQAFAVHKSRARLRDLEPHLLRDIGLTPAQAAAEADRTLWDIPPHWRPHGRKRL